MATTQKVRINVTEMAEFLNERFDAATVEQMTTWINEHADSIKSKRGRKPGSTNKKTKKKKDPNAPKRPLSAYMEYLAHHRPLLKATEPELKNTELISKIAKNWNDLQDKSEWEAKAAANKIEYAKLKEEYSQKLESEPQSEPEPESGSPKAVGDHNLTMIELDGKDWLVDFSVTPNKIYDKDSPTKMMGVLINGTPQFFS